MPARGRAMARGVALLFALAHNRMRAVALLLQWLGRGPTAPAPSVRAA